MFSRDEDDTTVYLVVANHEDQYSIWPQDRELPNGWRGMGKHGSKDECLAHIASEWRDMRPRSLREFLESADGHARARHASPTTSDQGGLLSRLGQGGHPVEVRLRPGEGGEALQAALGRGHARIKFTDTIGGTELGVEIDREASRLDDTKGTAYLEGTLTLDFEPIRCMAEIDVSTLKGTGRIERR